MGAEGFKRKITAIMSSDVVGYSKLMGDDEAATVKTLESYKGVMSALIDQHRGRVAKPVIAAINGHCNGGGFELALACDIRIASEKAKFGVFEVRFGLHQGDGGIVRLVAIAGLATALELSLTGREVTAEEAYRLRLVTKVVPHENLIETAEQYASIIMGNSQQAIRSAKETILDVVGRTLDDALRIETLNSYSSLGDFSEARERLSQFYLKGKGKQKS